MTVLLALSAFGAHAEVLTRGSASVSVVPYAPNIVRVTMSLLRDQAEAGPGYGVSASPAPAGWTHTASGGSDSFSSDRLSVEVDAPYKDYPTAPAVKLRVKTAQGRVLLDMLGWSMAPHTVQGEATYRVSALFAAPDDEHFYGLGQNQDGVLDLRGRTIDCRHNYDAPAGESVCVPFMVSDKGYGVVWDNPSPTEVAPGLNERTKWTSQVGERVSFFVIAGETTDAIYAGYRLLTGSTPLPPKAALGLIQSKQRYASQAEVLAAAAGYRSRGYPADIMVVDWFYWTKMGQFDMDPAKWPDPTEMNQILHAQGFQSLISVWPRFAKDSRPYETLARDGLLLKSADGAPVDGLPVRYDRFGGLIDSTNPKAREVFWGLIRDNLAAKGFDGFWTDETEPDLVPDGGFFSIGSGTRFHNLFPLVHTQGVFEGFTRDAPERRPLILARAAYLGAQRYGSLFWSSDITPTWDALRRQVPTGLNFAATGLAYWGNDIGGWEPLPDKHKPAHPPLIDPSDARAVVGGYDDYPELFTRWFEYGAFLPTLRIHGSRKAVEIWAYSKTTERILAKYLRLRYRLMPYIYSAARNTYDTGAPFMRALFMDFPADPAVKTVGDEYMFGPSLLVAPVTAQGSTSRAVYLPKGADWYDFWTGRRYPGGRTITAAAPIETLPLFVRAGSILPMGAPVHSTAEPQALEAVCAYPGVDAALDVYEDDGRTNAYQRAGGFRRSALRWDEARRTLTIDGAPASFLNPSACAVGRSHVRRLGTRGRALSP